MVFAPSSPTMGSGCGLTLPRCVDRHFWILRNNVLVKKHKLIVILLRLLLFVLHPVEPRARVVARAVCECIKTYFHQPRWRAIWRASSLRLPERQ